MKQPPGIKRGTTPHWQQPWCGTYELTTKRESEVVMVDLLDVLVVPGMAQSKAEARRLIKQGRVWDIDERTYDSRTQKIVACEPRKLTDRQFPATAGCRLVVGEPKFVVMKKGEILDLQKGKLVLFLLPSRV